EGRIAAHDCAALARIDAEPAARRGSALVLDAERGLDDEARAVADLEVGSSRRGEDGRSNEKRGKVYAHQRWISVPAPRSVSNSSSTACCTLPSRMTTPSTPRSSASMQVSTFGIMPPEIVPSAINLRASLSESSLMSFFDLSSTPGTSVSSRRR